VTCAHAGAVSRDKQRSPRPHRLRWRKWAKVERGVFFDAFAAWQLCRVPTTAQCLDQGGARDELALSNVDRSLGVGQRGLIGDDNTGIRDGSGEILVVDDSRGLECRGHGLVLNLGLLGEDAQTGELVLDLLERGENGLPVIRDALVEDGSGLLNLGVARAGPFRLRSPENRNSNRAHDDRDCQIKNVSTQHELLEALKHLVLPPANLLFAGCGRLQT
jgi:hypothetical protein